MTIYDISQSLAPGIAVWPGDRPYLHEWTARMADGGAYNLSAVRMSVHTGTHLDAPLHVLDGRTDIADVSIQRLVGPARVVSVLGEQAISSRQLAGLSMHGVERILFRTRTADPPEGQFDTQFSFLTEDGADFLCRQGIVLVGTDSPSVDAFASKDLPAHKKLMSEGIAVLEGLRLAAVPEGDYELICLPLKLRGAEGSPVRAVLRK